MPKPASAPPRAFNPGRIAGTLSAQCGLAVDPGSVLPVGDPDGTSGPADATLKYRLTAADGAPCHLLISSAGNPKLIARAVENIRYARGVLSPATAAPILEPVATGEIDSHSFAVWPTHRPYLSDGRLVRALRRLRHARAIAEWSDALTVETLQDADPATVAADLTALARNDALPAAMRGDARDALNQLDSGQWRPKSCLQHGDLWAGNLLLGAGQGPAFHVIDWAGMQRAGYPFYDLARFLSSVGGRPAFRQARIEALRQRLGCEQRHIAFYLLANLGQIGAHLEQFPPKLYRSMATELYAFIR